MLNQLLSFTSFLRFSMHMSQFRYFEIHIFFMMFCTNLCAVLLVTIKPNMCSALCFWKTELLCLLLVMNPAQMFWLRLLLKINNFRFCFVCHCFVFQMWNFINVNVLLQLRGNFLNQTVWQYLLVIIACQCFEVVTFSKF